MPSAESCSSCDAHVRVGNCIFLEARSEYTLAERGPMMGLAGMSGWLYTAVENCFVNRDRNIKRARWRALIIDIDSLAAIRDWVRGSIWSDEPKR